MSKVICKVCGTAYPDSASVCPICGSSPQGKNEKSTAEKKSSVSDKKAPKGGYYTKANVKKRTKASQKQKLAVSVNAREPKPRLDPQSDEKKKRGPWIAILLILLLILALAAYIVVTYALPYFRNDVPTPSESSTPSVSDNNQSGIPCTEITLSRTSMTFAAKGDVLLLDAKPVPFDTTDRMVFASSNEKVVTVNPDGSVTAVGPGEAIVTVTCGDVSVACKAVCTFAAETTVPPATTKPVSTDPKETTDPKKTVSAEEFSLDRDDITLSYRGETFQFQIGKIPYNSVIWTSDDPGIASIENGVVKAIHSGTTTVYGSYEGKTVSCIVRCNFPDSDGDGGDNQSSGGNSENRPDEPARYIINHIDVTLYVGSTFLIELYDTNDNPVDVEWYAGDSNIISVYGNEVTGISGGMTTVYCVYEGETYQCIVRVYYSD